MIKTLHERRRRLDTVLNEWETKFVKEVKEIFEKESRVLNDNISICSDIVPEVRTNIQKMQDVLKKSEEDCFIEMTEKQRDKNKYNDIFREMHKVSCTIEKKLEKDNILKTINSHFKDLNKINVRHYKDRNALPSFSTRPYKVRVALDAGEINVFLQSDVKSSLITRIEVLHEQDNKIFLYDHDNRKLKLLDLSNGSWTEKSCSSSQWRISKTDVPNEIIVTLPEETCLQLFSINQNGQIMTDVKYETKQRKIYDIIKHQNDFITLELTRSENIFDVTNKNGKFNRNIRKEKTPSKLFQCTTYLDVDINAEILYVADHEYGCTGLSMTGAVVFRYNDKLEKECVGVTTDQDGNVYLSGEESNNVVMVNSKGETIKELLNGLENPRFMKYDELTNTLFVYMNNSPIVKMFHLM